MYMYIQCTCTIIIMLLHALLLTTHYIHANTSNLKIFHQCTCTTSKSNLLRTRSASIKGVLYCTTTTTVTRPCLTHLARRAETSADQELSTTPSWTSRDKRAFVAPDGSLAPWRGSRTHWSPVYHCSLHLSRHPADVSNNPEWGHYISHTCRWWGVCMIVVSWSYIIVNDWWSIYSVTVVSE